MVRKEPDGATVRPDAPISRLSVEAYRIPTDAPEADGTFDWSHTMLLLVTAEGGGERGIGYGYADAATARLIADTLTFAVVGCDAFDTNRAWSR